MDIFVDTFIALYGFYSIKHIYNWFCLENVQLTISYTLLCAVQCLIHRANTLAVQSAAPFFLFLLNVI